MSRPPMKVRTIRFRIEEWEAALETADDKGEVLSEKVQEYVRRYGAAKLREKRAQEAQR